MFEILGYPLTRTEIWIAAACLFLLAVGGLWGYWIWRRRRITPEEAERRRRARLVEIGKMGDASLIEIREDLLCYSYLVRGVEYIASQDVSLLREYLPPHEGLGLSTVGVRYDPRNPADSIILAELWSGLRATIELPHHDQR
jgi:hypothetical protein